MHRHLICAVVALALALGLPSAAAAQASPEGPCTRESAEKQFPRAEGHEHTNIAIHRAACRVVQDAFLPLNKDLKDEVLGEMDIKAGIAAVAVTYPQAGVLFFDVTDSARPKFLSRYQSSECEGAAIDVDCGAFVDLSADGKFAFLSIQQISVVPGRLPPSPGSARPALPGVEVIDVSAPASPRLAFPYPVASEGGVHAARSHVVKEGPSGAGAPRAPGEYVFSVANGLGIDVSRLSRTPSPRLQQVARISIAEVHDMFLDDDPTTGRTYMYVAAGFNTGFLVYDVTDPAQAKLLGEWDLTPQCTSDWYSHTIDVVTRNGRRLVTMPAELFNNGASSASQQALGCGKVRGNGDKPGPLWIVDATDFSKLAQAGDSDAVVRAKSESALIATWTNAADAPGGDLAFSPHNQQVVGDRIYLSGYHSGVTVLDASAAFAGVKERPKEIGFHVPTGEPTRPIYKATVNPLLIPFISKYLQYRPLIWDMVFSRGRILAADETGGFYSLRVEGDQPEPPLPPLPRGPAADVPGPVVRGAGARCTPVVGFRSVNVRGRGRGLRLGFVRAVRRPVKVDIFRQSVGRQVIGNRLVARFRRRTGSFNWVPGRRLGDGTYFARLVMRLPNGRVDVRRVVLRRTGGRFVPRPAHYRARRCDLLASFKLERPVFGGRDSRPLGISYTVRRSARVFVEVVRSGRVVRRFAVQTRRANVTHRLRLRPEGLARGDYQVRLQAVGRAETVTEVLTARRL